MSFGKWILVMGYKEEWEEKRKMKGMRSMIICCWWNIKHYSWPCSCARTDHEIRWHAGTSTGFYTIHITLAVHSSSISDERTFTILYTVNTVPQTQTLTVELICSQVLLTYICAELRVDCLGEETSFIRRLRICYSITNKDITNTVMQLGRMYLFIALQ